MGPKDRDYFMIRAEQELDAASRSTGEARGRHEELAWIYQMRVSYIDRGLVGEIAEALDDTAQGEVRGHIVLSAV